MDWLTAIEPLLIRKIPDASEWTFRDIQTEFGGIADGSWEAFTPPVKVILTMKGGLGMMDHRPSHSFCNRLATSSLYAWSLMSSTVILPLSISFKSICTLTSLTAIR